MSPKLEDEERGGGGDPQGTNNSNDQLDTTGNTPPPYNPPPPPPTYSYAQLRQFIRQNSEKMGVIAEDVVLPRNKRSVVIRRQHEVPIPEREAIKLETREAPSPSPSPTPPPYAPTTTTVVEVEKLTKRDSSKGVGVKPASEFPIFMVVISVLQVFLFASFDETTLLLLFGYDPYRRYELWRYLTIMLAHSDKMHLIGNVVLQLILGVLLEIVHHWKRMGIIYVASVVGGCLFITVISPNVYAVGASAGVYGLLFAHLSTIIINWDEMDRKCCRLFWLLLYIGYDVGINLLAKFVLEVETNTSHAGHFGGAVTGFLVAILCLKNFEEHPWEKRMQKICMGILITLFSLIVLINIFAWPLYLPAAWNFDYEDSYVHHILEALKKYPEDSVVRRTCEADLNCKLLLDQYIHNGTIANVE